MSMSTAADIFAGSVLPTSSTIGKLSVWSAARFSDVVPPPPPQAATTEIVPSATARERNTANRLIPPPTKPGLEEGALEGSPPRSPSPSSRWPGARVRRRRTYATLFSWMAPLLHPQFWALVHRSQVPMTFRAHAGG